MQTRIGVMAAAVLALACLPPPAAAEGGGCPILYLAGSIGWTAKNNDISDVDTSAWEHAGMGHASNCTAEEYDAIAGAVVEFAKSKDFSEANLLRAGFHLCGTYSASGRDAGCDGGWLKYEADADHSANAGLPGLLTALDEKRTKDWSCITFADLVTLAASVATESAGGPAIAWHPGRRDALGPGPTKPAYSARLPSGAFEPSGILYYYTNLGLTVREMVALTGGGHSIGGASEKNSGWAGIFTPAGDKWPEQKNQYFLDLLDYGWTQDYVGGRGERPDRLQYILRADQGATLVGEDGSTKVFRLPSDMALRGSRVFAEWALVYYMDEALFMADFARVMQRVMQLGSPFKWSVDNSYTWRGLNGTACDYTFDGSIHPAPDSKRDEIWTVGNIATLDDHAERLTNTTVGLRGFAPNDRIYFDATHDHVDACPTARRR